MLWLQRHSTAALYTIYALTVMLMIFCIITFYYYAIIDLNRPEGSNSHPFYVTEYSLMFCVFFGTANAMVIFRMFSLNLITLIVHALVHGVVVICLILHLVLFHPMEPVKSFYHSYWVQVYVMLAVYVLQCLLALDLIIFKPGKTALQREKRSGMHAFIGVITFVVVFWNMMLMISMLCINPEHSKSADDKLSYGDLLTEPSFLIVFVAIYMLLILFILLTPFFRADARELIAAEEECKMESDLAELQLLQAGYLYETEEEEDDRKTKAKIKNIPRQDLLVLTISQATIGGRHRSTPQDSHVDQMTYRLEEVWKADPVVSQTSLEVSSCRSNSPPPSKCTPLKRVEKIRRRGAAASQCLVKKEPEPKCGCSKTCQNPNRCRSRFSSGSTAASPKHIKRSCSQINLSSTTCRRSSPKSSSAPCKMCEEDDWHLLKYEQTSLTSFEERNLYSSSRGSRCGKTALTSQMDISSNDYCSCSKTQNSDDKDMPFGICSTTSEMDLAIDRVKCAKTAARNKTEQDLSRCCKTAKSPATKPIKTCMSCGRCSIPSRADTVDGKPTYSKASPKNRTEPRPKKIRVKKDVPIGKLATPPQYEDENIRRGRFFSPSYRTKMPHATRSGSDIQLTSAPPTENLKIVTQSEKVSTPSQTDAACEKYSFVQTELDPAEALYSRLPSAPSSSFKYTDKPIISERVPSVSKADLASKPSTSAPLQKRRLSAPTSSTKHLTKSTNTQPTTTTTTASQTDFTLDRQNSEGRLQAVPSLHEIKPQERRSSLRSSTEADQVIVDLRSKVVDKPMPEKKSKDAEAKRNVPSAKLTPKNSGKSLIDKQLSIKDTDSTKSSTKQATKPAAEAVNSSMPRSSSVDRIDKRSSIVDFDLNNRSLKSDPKLAPSISSVSKNSHGSSSSSDSSDSIKR